jgi:uncharacterized protein (UPF0548 family)
MAAPRLTYAPVGATAPARVAWAPPPRWRARESTVALGSGERRWAAASAAVLEWAVKTRSGFEVEATDGGPLRVAEGRDFRLIARVGPLRVREPVRVVAVVERPDRYGFAYGTLPGHPVSGEEAFIVSRDDAGDVRLTLRSMTRPGAGVWRPVFPALLLAQGMYRRRYARALLPPSA